MRKSDFAKEKNISFTPATYVLTFTSFSVKFALMMVTVVHSLNTRQVEIQPEINENLTYAYNWLQMPNSIFIVLICV